MTANNREDAEQKSEHNAGEASSFSERPPIPPKKETPIGGEEINEPDKKPKPSYDGGKDGTKITDWILIGLTGALVFVGISQCSTYISQRDIMRNQLMQMQGQLNEMQRSTAAEIRAAKASEDGTNAIIQQFQIDERPWIAIKSAALMPPESGKPLHCEIKIINIGKTIARFVLYPGVIQTSYSPVEFAKEVEQGPDYHPITGPTIGAMFPSVDANMPLVTITILTTTEATDIMSGKLSVYICGEIIYGDTFSTSGAHVTNFFMRYVPETCRFEAMRDHNDAN